ncbi:unnamed protein product (macronuclear) [Paramecium tetraurelia]|uniref:Uncharacterized protein n=1 Tax=Paramecium tetraurelia TaxID=5888 RepID=A0EHP7_PARTE|nr:uncharacterized protein GSPATT00027164001 [Paramecium tetraurelia]CAK94838.1 unnamed protein product [Paramecium tetraurelia]|eukprot:XP_001462211.1 hypothetical protein (macronuclear) [Paramecium tetraurelia strain d4-2]
MSVHGNNSGIQIAQHQSPSRIIKEVSDASKELAARKVLERKISELELKLKQQDNLIQRQQSQLEEATQETQQIGRQFEDALNDVRQMKLIGEKKDQQIGMLLEENDKIVQLLEMQRSNQQTDVTDTIQKLEQQVRDRFLCEKRLNDEIQSQKIKLHQVEDQLKDRNHLIEDLREKLSHREKQCSTDASLGVLANKRAMEIEILTLQNGDLQLKVQDLTSKIQLLLEENGNLQKTIGTQNNEVKLQQEDKFQRMIKILNENHQKDMLKLKEQHKLEIKEKTDLIQNLKANQSLNNQNNNYVEELKSAKNTISNLQSEMSKLTQSSIKSVQGESDDIQQQYEKLLKKNNQLSEQNFLLQQKIRMDEASNKEKISELEKGNEKLLEIQQANEAKIEELQQKLKQLPTKVREKSLSDLKLKVEQTKLTEFDNKIQKLQEKVDSQNQEIKEKTQKINQLQDQVKQAIYEKDNAIQQIKLECAQEVKQVQDQMKIELQNQQKQFNEAQRPIQEQMKSSSIEQNKLKTQAQRYQNEIKALENRIASKYQSQMIDLLIENEQIRTQMEKLKATGESLMKDKQNQELKIQDNLREIESWKEKYVKSVSNGEKQNDRAQKEQAKAEGLKEEINKLNEQLEQIVEQNNTLEEQLQQAQQESRNLRNQLIGGVKGESSSGNKSNGLTQPKA